MQSGLTLCFLALMIGQGWAACNPATRQSFDAFMDCMDRERETRDAYDRYRQDTDRRLDELERERRFRETCPDCR